MTALWLETMVPWVRNYIWRLAKLMVPYNRKFSNHFIYENFENIFSKWLDLYFIFQIHCFQISDSWCFQNLLIKKLPTIGYICHNFLLFCQNSILVLKNLHAYIYWNPFCECMFLNRTYPFVNSLMMNHFKKVVSWPCLRRFNC